MKLCDAEFMRIKVYNYDNEFFEGRSPERKLSPIYNYTDILNTQAQQLNTEEELFETNDVYMWYLFWNDNLKAFFFTLFEQFPGALPQFVIGSFFYISNSNDYFPITLATLILSAGSFVTGLITTFSVGRSIFMKLCDARIHENQSL